MSGDSQTVFSEVLMIALHLEVLFKKRNTRS